MNKIFRSTEIFTPSTIAKRTFVERREINTKLVDAILTPGKQLVLYGFSGSGKTTVITNKLFQLEGEFITTSAYSDMTFEELVLSAFDQLGTFYIAEKENSTNDNFSAKIGLDYLAIKGEIAKERENESSDNLKRIVPPQLTYQRLANFFGEAKCRWIIEDFHKMKDPEKSKLSELMKIFMDTSSNFPLTKIIVIGAVQSPRELLKFNKELRNRIVEIKVPLMSVKELSQIITLGEKHLNLSIRDSIKKEIARYSNGLASVCHQICLNYCLSNGINETSKKLAIMKEGDLERSILKYVEDNMDFFESLFEKVLNSEVNKKIIESILKIDDWKFKDSQVIEVMGKYYPKQSRPVILQGLSNLSDSMRKEIKTAQRRFFIFEKKQGSDIYNFVEPFHRAFLKVYFDNEKTASNNG